MRRNDRFLLVALSFFSLCTTFLAAQPKASPKSSQQELAALVGKTRITQAQVDLYLTTLGLPEDQWDAHRSRAVDQLIERTLVRQFLNERNVTPPSATLDRQLALVEQVLRNEENPEEALKKLGMTRDELQAELSLPLAWRRYVRQIVSERQIAEYFEKHQNELDGTKRKAAQIFLKLPQDASEAEIEQAKSRLNELKQQIQAGQLTFAEAARQHSESPSAAKGGDMGAFTFSGQMPAAIAKQAFKTPVGEISEPFASSFGVHLLHVTEEIPGQFSLEDARPAILDRYSAEVWKQAVDRLKQTTRVVRLVD